MFHWQEILFSGAVILSYFATGIACAVYASQWGEKPAVCESVDDASEDDDDTCDSVPLSATNALQAVCISSIGSEFSLLYLPFCVNFYIGILFHSTGGIWTHSCFDSSQHFEEQETDTLTSL